MAPPVLDEGDEQDAPESSAALWLTMGDPCFLGDDEEEGASDGLRGGVVDGLEPRLEDGAEAGDSGREEGLAGATGSWTGAEPICDGIGLTWPGSMGNGLAGSAAILGGLGGGGVGVALMSSAAATGSAGAVESVEPVRVCICVAVCVSSGAAGGGDWAEAAEGARCNETTEGPGDDIWLGAKVE